MKKCALFDMDGVVIDTEPQYTAFWNDIANRYNIGVESFENEIKGMTIPHILNSFFSHLSEKELEQLLDEFRKFEECVVFPDIPQAIDFIKELKANGIKVGLVTSATEFKLNRVREQKLFDTLFDVIISAKDIENGKPAPDCFLLGAKRLNVSPTQTVVFEDSLAGIEAGNAAGMAVVGLSTTHAQEELKDKCVTVIPDFCNVTAEWFKSITSK